MVFSLILPKEAKEIVLPRTLNHGTIFLLINGVIGPDDRPLYQKIKFNWHNVEFAEPVGVTVLSNVIEFLRKSGVRVTFSDYDLKSPGFRYLDDSGFFRHYFKHSIGANASLRPTTLPLELVS